VRDGPWSPVKSERWHAATGGARSGPGPEGRCIPHFQIYRVSAQTDFLLVWRSIRCDARGSTHVQHAGVERVSGSFHAHREPRQSTRFGARRDNSFSRFNDGTFPMRLPSGTPGACALPAATSLRFTPLGSRRTRILALTAFISFPWTAYVILKSPHSSHFSPITSHVSQTEYAR
jgi:hypothetical protein